MTVRAPARGGRERAGHDRAELVGADHRGGRRGRGGELDDPGSFAANAGSLLLVQDRGRRHLTPSARRIRRTWERCTSIPAARAASVSVVSVHTAGLPGSAAANSPPAHPALPGGVVVTRAIIR